MKKTLAIAVTLIAGLWSYVQAGDARDLTRYETRGPYVLHERVITAEDRVAIHAQMREFLSSCWQRHRRGRLITLEFSIEGFSTRATYLVEPDKHGAWHVVVETIATLPAMKPGTDEQQTEESTAIATLEHVKAADGKKHIRIVSGDKVLLEL